MGRRTVTQVTTQGSRFLTGRSATEHLDNEFAVSTIMSRSKPLQSIQIVTDGGHSQLIVSGFSGARAGRPRPALPRARRRARA